MKRHVQTGNGISTSTSSFQWTPENNIGGIGQGNGEGPQACNDQMGLLKTIHCKQTAGFTITTLQGTNASSYMALVSSMIRWISLDFLPTN
jgi:hypothetical protein